MPVAGRFTTAMSIADVKAPEPLRKAERARSSLVPASKSNVSGDFPVHHPDRHWSKVRASSGAPSAANWKFFVGQFVGVGAKLSGTTIRSCQLHAPPSELSIAYWPSMNEVSSLWSAQLTSGDVGEEPGFWTPPQFGTTTIEQRCDRSQPRKLFSTL